jgi:hypothetical protein
MSFSATPMSTSDPSNVIQLRPMQRLLKPMSLVGDPLHPSRPVDPILGRPWPMLETATVQLHSATQPCDKCSRRPGVVSVEDGVLVDEEIVICAPCLLDAVSAYPEHND